jgi:hypothetical protein
MIAERLSVSKMNDFEDKLKVILAEEQLDASKSGGINNISEVDYMEIYLKMRPTALDDNLKPPLKPYSTSDKSSESEVNSSISSQ